MNIENFEQHVNNIIVERGLDYFWEGRVEQLAEQGDNLYVATVAGSDDYSVIVQLNEKDVIVKAECDCPYTGGPYCKHLVAFFFALREKKGDMTADISNGGKSRQEATQEDVRQELLRILSRQPLKKLVELLVSLADDHAEIGDRIRAEFSSRAGEKEKWVKLMRRYIEKAMDDDGFINYRDCQYAVEGAYKVLERAQRAIDEEERELAIDLLLCVMGAMVDMLQYADDSAGDVGMVMDEVNSILATIIWDSPVGPVAEACFDKCFCEARAKRYDGWEDWRFNLLDRCADLAVTNRQRSQLEQYLEYLFSKSSAIDGDGLSFSSKYEAEAIILLRYSLISKFEDDETAANFLYEHRSYPRCRELAIQEAVAAKEYGKAEELALEGEELNRTLPGLVADWKKRRFELYQLWGQMDKLRAVGRELALLGEFSYYLKLKATYDPQEWTGIFPGIIEALSNRPGYFNDTYTAALIEERDWANLMAYTQNNPRRITDFYRYLLPDYREQVYEVFTHIILDGASRASKRSAYRGVCSHLRLLAKIGGGDRAAELVKRLLRDNPRKPAFREELHCVKCD